MGVMTKLLNKPLKAFISLAAVILACSIPVYLLLIEYIWSGELDDHNKEVVLQIQQGFNGLSNQELDNSINLWNRVHPESKISTTKSLITDSTYTTERLQLDGVQYEIERFRGRLSGITINNRPYSVRVETNLEEAHETTFAISLITFLFIGLLIFGFIILNRRLSKRIWSPFMDTLEKLKHFDLNTASQIDLAKTDIVEFTELNTVLTKLIDSNVLVYSQQKEFTQNASHELQTPLAILKSKIDLLIQDTTLTQQQRETINSLSESVSRIGKINKNLLLLAGIENRSYASSQIVLNDLISRTLNEFKEYLSGNRTVNENLQDKVILTTNENLLEALITNLLSNSFRHSNSEAKITVELFERKLTIKNSGDTSLKPEALFKRFQSATPDNPGTGLGLAIAKEICNKYGWTIAYQFSNNEHQFSVTF